MVVRDVRRAVVGLGRELPSAAVPGPAYGDGGPRGGTLSAVGVITLADEAPGISNEELRSRLLMLAQRAERRS